MHHATIYDELEISDEIEHATLAKLAAAAARHDSRRLRFAHVARAFAPPPPPRETEGDGMCRFLHACPLGGGVRLQWGSR